MPEEYKTIQGGPMKPKLFKALDILLDAKALTINEAVAVAACVTFAAHKPKIFSDNGGGDSWIEVAQELLK